MLSNLQELSFKLKPLANFLEKRKKYLWLILVTIFLIILLINLNNWKLLPFQWSDFVFFTFLVLSLALYRPSWVFIFFIGTIPLENINLAPLSLGIALRPYQFFGALAIGAILMKIIIKKLNFSLRKIDLEDYLIIAMLVAGLISSFFAKSIFRLASFKLMLIFMSFVGLYFLSKNYLQNRSDIKKIIPFVLTTSGIIISYGIWQNIQFKYGLNSFEVMPGRPNATFAEADWLGMYLVLIIAVLYAVLFYFSQLKKDIRVIFANAGSYLLLLIAYVLLILTVSRSAWLAVILMTGVFFLVVFTNLKINFRKWKGKSILYWGERLGGVFLASIVITVFFQLTNFQLFNRIHSTQTGLQKITIACSSQNNQVLHLPSRIKNITELKKYGCRFIRLQEIEEEKKAGKIVTQIYRTDPNVAIRGQIYQKTWKSIKQHPILGIGWASIGSLLGEDEQGNYLNASNLFLETWLGMGISGLLVLLVLLGVILIKALKNYYQAQSSFKKSWNLFVIISWLGVIMVNLFNAGMLLGIFWLWLGAITGKEK